MLFNTIAEGVYPNYSVGTNQLSDLGLGSNTAALWNGQLLVTGLLVLSGMYLLFYRSQFRVGLARANRAGVLLMLPGVGAILVSLGIVPALGNPSNFFDALLHVIGAVTAFLFGGISALYAFKLTSAPFRYFSVVLWATTLATLPVYLFTLGVPLSGLLERLVLYPYILWVIGFGSYLLAVPAERR